MTREEAIAQLKRKERKRGQAMTGAINRLVGYVVGLLTMYIIMRITGRGGKHERFNRQTGGD